MKNNLLKTVIILLAVTFVTLLSCKKESLEIQKSESELESKISVKAGMLKFATFDDFNEAYTYIAENGQLPEEIAELDFVSMLDLVEMTDNAGSEAEYNEMLVKHNKVLFEEDFGVVQAIVEDNSIAALLSVEGNIWVGNEIRRIGREYVKVIENGDISKIHLFDEITNPENTYGVHFEKIVRQADKSTWSTNFYKTYSSTNKYKIYAKKWANSYGTWNTVGGSLDHYHWTKSWGKWKWKKVKAGTLSISISWDALDYNCHGVMMHEGAGSISKTKYNESALSKQRLPCGGIGYAGPITATNLTLTCSSSTGVSGTF